METRADHQTFHDPSAPPPAAYPRWILLDEYFQIPDTKTVAPPAAYPRDDPDTKTVAHARTSKGYPISVSFVLATPPAVSRLRLGSPGLPLQYGANARCHPIAAHGDSVLLKIERRSSDYYDDNGPDYFLYCVGDAAADPSRPPSLSLHEI
jgi:hypothetical protein